MLEKQLLFDFMKEEQKIEKFEKIKDLGKELGKGLGMVVLCSPLVIGIPLGVAYAQEMLSTYFP